MDSVAPRDRKRVADVCRRLSLASPTVTPLVGGSRNRSYRLADGRLDVVLRIDGEHDAAYEVTRESEHQAQRLAAAHGLAAPLLFAGPGHAVSEYVAGAPWSRHDAASPAGAARVGYWMARLHALPVPAGLRSVRFLASLEAYAAQVSDAAPVGALVDTARQVEHDLGRFAPVLCHNDLHHLNLIDSPRGLVAIDWEYAGTGDPRMDLAGYVAYHELDGAAVSALLEAYALHRAACPRGELDRARWLFEAVWYGWLELRLLIEGGETDDSCHVRGRLRRRLVGDPGND